MFENKQQLRLKAEKGFFYVDGIYPAGQAGMTENQYNIVTSTGNSFRIKQSIADQIFCVVEPVTEESETELSRQEAQAMEKFTAEEKPDEPETEKPEKTETGPKKTDSKGE